MPASITTMSPPADHGNLKDLQAHTEDPPADHEEFPAYQEKPIRYSIGSARCSPFLLAINRTPDLPDDHPLLRGQAGYNITCGCGIDADNDCDDDDFSDTDDSDAGEGDDHLCEHSDVTVDTNS